MSGLTFSRVGPYLLAEQLGEGGMGVVFRAVHDDGREVALKLVRGSLSTIAALQRFEREARVRIEHPNVVRVLDAGSAPEGPYIAFELLEGETLAERIRRGRLGREETLELGVQACRGLAAAHDAGIIHRDLKPSNLFVCADGTLKLLDFGVARLTSLETRLTQSGQVVGTLAYLSPEQAERRATIDHRTDLWSLGAVLYECLAGRPPFGEDSALATLVAVMLGEPTPLSSLAPEAGAVVHTMLMKALSKRAESRFVDAHEFGAALSAARDQSSDVVMIPPTLRPDEQRAVVLLYASGVHDEADVTRAIRAEGGTPVLLPKERVLGLFGGEDSAGDEVVRATAAAVMAREGAARVAVSAGRATGDETGIRGTAIDAAQAALQSGTTGIALSADAARELRGMQHLLTPRGEHCVELASDSSTLDALRAGPERAPLVGRELELAQVQEVMQVVTLERSAQLVTIEGPPGIGKSRLCAELRASIDATMGARVLECQLTARGGERELSLWTALLLGRAQALGVTLEVAVETLAALAHPPGSPEHTRISQTLSILLRPSRGAVDEGAPTEIQLIDDRLRIAIADWVLGALAQQPLALIVEDAHRADVRSLELLSDVIERAHDRPLFVLLTTRTGLTPLVLDSASFTRIPLRGLRRAPARAHANRKARRELPDALVERIIERTEGNPFFIEQIALALPAELGEGLDDEAALPLPLSVETAVQSRLDALAPGERELCKVASVWGRGFSLAELEALGANGVKAGARSLRRKGLWAVRAADRLDFVSGLVRDVSYRLLVESRRRPLHAMVAAGLALDPRADPEEVAAHFELGGDERVAAEWFASAAISAAWRGDAVSVLRASDAAERLDPGRIERFDLRMARAEALRFRGARDAQRAELEAALQQARDPAERARVGSELCVCFSRLGRHEDALASGASAVADARLAQSAYALALAEGRNLLAELAIGDLEAARESSRRAEVAAQTCAEPRVKALLEEWRGQLAAAEGHLEARMEAFSAAATLHREFGDLRRAAGAETNVADVLNRVGAYPEAERSLRAAIDSCRRVGHRAMEGYARLNLAYSLLHQHQAEAALEELDEAQRVADRITEPRLLNLVRTYRAKALIERGRSSEARSTAQHAADECASHGFSALEVGARTELGRAHLALGEPAEALAQTRLAYDQLCTLGGVEEDEILVFLTHAQAADAAGDTDTARQVTAEGVARLEALSAEITDADLREGFRVRVAAHRELTERASRAPR